MAGKIIQSIWAGRKCSCPRRRIRYSHTIGRKEGAASSATMLPLSISAGVAWGEM